MHGMPRLARTVMVKQNKKRNTGKKASLLIFDLLRKRIAEALRADGLEVAEVSQLELAIGTFVPSNVVKGFKISDYPFIHARYVSCRDGHVYVVAGATDSGDQILAYRIGFLTSIFTTKGGAAVGITEDGWMNSDMILFSLQHAHFEMEGGQIEGVNGDRFTRRAYPIKKVRAYGEFLKRYFFNKSA